LSVGIAWAKSTAPNKVDRAMNVFREMKALYRSGDHEHLKPNVIAYNAVMNACAFCNNVGGGGSTSISLQEQSHAMEMAHSILKEMEQSSNEFNVTPDQVTYGTFLKVCANQLPDCSTRQQIVEVLFKKCVRDGQVGNLVLQQLKTMINEELYMRLIGKPQNADITMEDLPQEWWCNVVEGKGRWKRS
jgi:Pentatricopeptide repeat domain